ncbi:MAG: hypothetical protein ACRD2Z_01340 [Thermoanaerobaculia bacterium]
MYRLAFRVALAWVVACGVVSPSLSATQVGEGSQRDPRQPLISGLPVAAGLAAVRAGSSPSPEQGARALAFAGAPALPLLTAVVAVAERCDVVARLLLESPHPQRGPPPPPA